VIGCDVIVTQATPEYISVTLVVVLYRIIPAAKVLGLWAVVPVGTVSAPVVDEALITPESAVKTKLPVVSPVVVMAVVVVVPVLIVDILDYHPSLT
jgi:hypothetical protein